MARGSKQGEKWNCCFGSFCIDWTCHHCAAHVRVEGSGLEVCQESTSEIQWASLHAKHQGSVLILSLASLNCAFANHAHQAHNETLIRTGLQPPPSRTLPPPVCKVIGDVLEITLIPISHLHWQARCDPQREAFTCTCVHLQWKRNFIHPENGTLSGMEYAKPYNNPHAYRRRTGTL